jgi:NAD(P)-dependent dehydrogenase (short-subunit alcohol dehydrogenase family)
VLTSGALGFSNKVAFITGGSSGIGLGIAQAFVEAGMKVVISYRTQAHLDEAMQCLAGAGDRVHAIQVDVTDRAGLKRAAEETVRVFGRVHVLVSNAGAQFSGPLEAMPDDEWDRLIEVNVTGVFNSVQAFLPHIRVHGEGGHLITTASILGLLIPRTGGGYGAYCASKFAVVGFTEALRAELAGTNIGASAFCPGMVKSNLEEWLKDHHLAADPLEIGRLVLRGMQRNDLYILTHPEFTPLIELRQRALAAAALNDVSISAERRALKESLMQRDSIYK